MDDYRKFFEPGEHEIKTGEGLTPGTGYTAQKGGSGMVLPNFKRTRGPLNMNKVFDTAMPISMQALNAVLRGMVDSE